MTRGRRDAAHAGPVAAVQEPLASGMTLVGLVLVVLGVLRTLVVLEVLPEDATAVVGAGWPVLVVGAGVWSMTVGRRVTGAALALLGTVLLVATAVPAGVRLPVLLIGLGVLLLWASLGGRRWLLGGVIAVFKDVRASGPADEPARSYVAVFGESSGRIDAAAIGDELVECLGVFGDVEVQVPGDVAVELSETAVFGEVRSPGPPTRAVTSKVRVRATSVFGDVRLVRE